MQDGFSLEQPDLKTERLLLRPFTPADAADVQRLANNDAVSGPTLNMPYPYEPGIAEKWISAHRRDWEFRTSAVYAVTLTDTSLLLGTVSLTWINRSMAELGYWIGEPYWGNGYCSEAVEALIGCAFEKLGIEKIVAEHWRANPASGRVMQKAGMRHAGSRRKKDRHRKPGDLESYEIRKPVRATMSAD